MGSSSNLFASIDMGTNSFKMLIVQADRSGKFLTIDRHKNPVCLGRDCSTSLSIESHARALECLQKFNQILKSNNVSPQRTRCVATAALREANNSIELRKAIHETTGLDVVVLPGEEEARFVYLGVLQFLPVFEKRVLVVDIGGGSTEFVIGERGNVILGISLKLGHVGLTQKFVDNGKVSDMREFVRLVIKESGLVAKVEDCGFEVVVGTSGTIRAIEKAVFYGYGQDLVSNNEILFRDCKRDWKFSRGELRCVVEKLCKEGEGERSRREGFFKRRSEFIVAGAVLLEEIFEVLEIEEMEVSGYALGEGVIAETLAEVFDGYDLNANARWHTVVRLATRFSDKKRIIFAARCASLANEIFEGLRKWLEISNDQDRINFHLAEKDPECLQAACLLHNMGLFTGKKGYHKQTYQIIMNGDYLHGYSDEEVKLIALLTRHHRKKFPKSDHSTMKEISEDLKKRFRILCVIIRLSVMLQQYDYLNFHDMEFLHSDEGFKLVFKEARDKTVLPVVGNMERELKKELAQSKIILQHQLSVEVKSCPLRLLFIFGMGLEERLLEPQNKKEKTCHLSAICVHAFSDLTYVSPVVFLYLLKECYVHGSCKATKKFRALQQQVHQALNNSPQPGPATFVVQCLHVLPIFGLYSEGFSHLIVSALCRFLKLAHTSEDTLQAKVLAARLFIDIVGGLVDHDERIVVKILEVFDVKLTNIEEAICQLKAQNDNRFDSGKKFVENYIFNLVESQSYMTAVTLLEHFSIRQSGQSFLLKMMQNKQSKAAEKWAAFMGKPMLRVLIQEYVDRNMLKHAYETIKKNNLKEEFPDVYHKCKESSLKKLAEKALWDIAEAKTHGDRQLVEYLVYLAMEAGYSEKVDELCDRYSLEGFLKGKELEASLSHGRYLHLKELVVEDIVWVDDVDGLCDATSHIEGCKVVGLDCEWKPNYEKGSKPNKVSIMQIASDKMVFIFDLIKLFEDLPDVLDNCLTRILQSPRILKLGYNFQCDIKQLAHSYGELKCFKHYEMLLDIQNVFREPRGGLSGLAEKILGAGLNKVRRNSNWEQRPLSRYQLEYAALDAVVLLHIFHHIRNHPQPAGVSEPEGHDKIEWKSCIVSHMDNPKKPKKGPPKSQKASEGDDSQR